MVVAPKYLIKLTTTTKKSCLEEDSFILGLKLFLQTIVYNFNLALTENNQVHKETQWREWKPAEILDNRNRPMQVGKYGSYQTQIESNYVHSVHQDEKQDWIIKNCKNKK